MLSCLRQLNLDQHAMTQTQPVAVVVCAVDNDITLNEIEFDL